MKAHLQKYFYDTASRTFHRTSDFFALLTIVSVISISLETVVALDHYQFLFLIIEYVAVFFFSLEYLGRIIAAKKPLGYIFSFFGIIDLLSIAPTFLGLANFTFLKAVRAWRMIRFLRLLRLVRIMRYRMQKYEHLLKKDDEDIHSTTFWIKIEIYIVIFALVVLGSSALMWLAEGDRAVFTDIPTGMLWSMKVLLGGVTSASVTSGVGEFVIIVTRFFGLILFSLLINISGGVLKKLIFGSTHNK